MYGLFLSDEKFSPRCLCFICPQGHPPFDLGFGMKYFLGFSRFCAHLFYISFYEKKEKCYPFNKYFLIVIRRVRRGWYSKENIGWLPGILDLLFN